MKAAYLIAGLTALGLSGCANISSSSLSANIASAEATIQQLALAGCGCVPTASSIANLIQANDPMLQTAEGIAKVICDAVDASSAPASSATPVSRRYAGVLYGRLVPKPVKIDGVVVTFQ